MTKAEVFEILRTNWKFLISLVIGCIVFMILSVVFTKYYPIDTTGNFVSAGGKHDAMQADVLMNGVWFPFIYSTLITMTFYTIFKKLKFWFAFIEINVALIAIFGLIQYKMIF